MNSIKISGILAVVGNVAFPEGVMKCVKYLQFVLLARLVRILIALPYLPAKIIRWVIDPRRSDGFVTPFN